MTTEFFELHYSNDVAITPIISEEIDSRNLDPGAILEMNDPLGFIWPYGDTSKKPLVYFHHATKDRVRFNGVTELGDTWLDHQKPGKNLEKFAQTGTMATRAYEKFDDGKAGWVCEYEEPFSQVIQYEDGTVRCRESDIIDLIFKPMKFINVEYGNMWKERYQFQQPCIISGFYDGIPVIGMGCVDSTYIHAKEPDPNQVFAGSQYIYMVGYGIRPDGRQEAYMCTIGLYNDRSNGINNAFYWVEGEEPVVVDNAQIETVWKHLPYVDDGTVVYKDAILHIGDKEIHFNGKWGTKGYTAYPKIERHGQSQIHGTWYEGKEPYEHKLWYAWGENNGAFDDVVKAYGFEVED